MTTEGVGQVVGVALVVALLLGFGALVALGALRLSRRMMQPRKPRAEQIAEFGRRFDGRPVVYHRTHWTFGPEEARAVAARHGYVEGPALPRDDHLLPGRAPDAAGACGGLRSRP